MSSFFSVSERNTFLTPRYVIGTRYVNHFIFMLLNIIIFYFFFLCFLEGVKKKKKKCIPCNRLQQLHNASILYLRIFILITFAGVLECRDTLTDTVPCPNGCGRRYGGQFSKYNLKKHLDLECGVGPMFSCSLCLKKFTRKSSLKRHSEMTHNIFFN